MGRERAGRQYTWFRRWLVAFGYSFCARPAAPSCVRIFMLRMASRAKQRVMADSSRNGWRVLTTCLLCWGCEVPVSFLT